MLDRSIGGSITAEDAVEMTMSEFKHMVTDVGLDVRDHLPFSRDRLRLDSHAAHLWCRAALLPTCFRTTPGSPFGPRVAFVYCSSIVSQFAGM